MDKFSIYPVFAIHAIILAELGLHYKKRVEVADGGLSSGKILIKADNLRTTLLL